MRVVRFRWYGQPGQEHPDAGDVLVLRDSTPERYLLVHGAAQVRGGTEDDLWLAVTRHRIGLRLFSIPQEIADAIDGGASVIYYTPGRPAKNSR